MHRTPHSPVGRQILFIIAAMVLCIVVPLLFHEATGGPVNTRNPWWSVAIIVVAGAAFAGVIASRSRQLFGMVFWLFTYLFMGLAPFVQYRLDVRLSTIPHIDADLYPIAGALVLMCSATYLAGSYFGGASRRPVRGWGPVTVNRRNTNIVSVAAVAAFLYYGQTLGFGVFLMTRSEASAYRTMVADESVMGLVVEGVMRMGLLVAFLGQMALRQQAKAAGRRPKWWPALILGALLLFVVNPLNSPRFTVGTVVLAMAAAFGVYATLTRFRVVAVSALVGLLVVFPLLDAFRHTTHTTVEFVGPVDALTSGDFDAFAQLTNTFDYLGAHGSTYGMQLLGVFLLWVPRSIWPGKPEATGQLLAEHMGYGFTNLSAPIWSELLINFGWAGVLIGMGAIGYLFRRWDAGAELHLRRQAMPPVVVSATAFYMLMLLRGSLLAVSAGLVIILAASWFITLKPRMRRRPHRTPTHQRPLERV